LSLPREPVAAPLAAFYLLDLLHAPRTSDSRRLPLQLALRYLVATFAADPLASHRMLGTLAFAAMEHPGFEVELEGVPVGVWGALGLPPVPAFLLRVPLVMERPEPQVPLVRQPVELRVMPALSLSGRVVGPDDIPLSNARVDLPMLQASTHTDARGHFCFGAVPARPETKELRVRVRNTERSVQVRQGAGSAQPLLIRFDTTEA
jgi:hypothetical protein